MASASSLTALFIGSGIAGLGAGLSSCLANVYIAEISPAEVRGEMGALAPLFSTAGAFTASSASSLLGLVEGGAWRWQLGIVIAPALLVLGLSHLLPESPRWLVASGKPAAAKETLCKLF